MTQKVMSIVFAGLGGQGVLKSSDIFGDVVFHAGYDVKKAEVHGMSQRGGSVTSDVRYGKEVQSPMTPAGGADFLVVLERTQIENNTHLLKPDGVMITPDDIDESQLENKRSLNVALLGVLSKHLDLDEEFWKKAIFANLPAKLHEVNEKAFALGRG
ncbi:MAG: indolepyruvate oxidoreductase subunit beta [Candidatus Sumerlaeia bacterium]